MQDVRLGRRKFIKGSVAAVTVAALPVRNALAQTPRPRLEWNQFKLTDDFAPFMNAIQAMRANTNASDRKSWVYWSNIHRNACPHSKPYFLAWHRGYLQKFQETVREVSGKSTLMVPYWDYYKNANLPAEFTDPTSPLYVSGRVNTNVRSGLSLTPFSSTYTNFQRGTTNSFETSIEYKPHGGFHNIIGGYMANLDSPMDPVFWFHHGQIDRLWAAWVAAGAGRTMPPVSDAYWSGSHVYRSDMTMPRNQTFNTTTYLNYTYTDLTMPKSLPPVAQAGSIVKVQFDPGQGIARRPGVGRFPVTRGRALGRNRRSVGGVEDVVLTEESVSAQIPVEAEDSQAIDAVIERNPSISNGRGRPPSVPYTSAQVTLNNLRTLPGGRGAGFFYDVYLNLPEGASGPQEPYFIGSFGPFEIDAASHHGGSLSFGATRALVNASRQQLRDLTVSFVRVSGPNSPKGPVIGIGEVRVELSTDPVE